MIVIVLPDIAEEDRLMVRARQGDKDALRQIYQDYFSPVYNFIRLRVDDGPQADDLTSEVFVKLMTAFRDGKAPRQSLRGWLFRVARNVLYDHFGGGQQKYTEEALEEWVPASREDSDQEIRLLIDEGYQRAKKILLEQRSNLDRVAKALLEREVIDAEEFDLLVSGGELKPLDLNGRVDSLQPPSLGSEPAKVSPDSVKVKALKIEESPA